MGERDCRHKSVQYVQAIIWQGRNTGYQARCRKCGAMIAVYPLTRADASTKVSA